jgi:hypothetical protein
MSRHYTEIGMYYEIITHIHVNRTTPYYDDSLSFIHRPDCKPVSVITDNEEVILTLHTG